MPIRIQRRRTKGWHMPAGAVSVTRPSEFGSPFRVVRADREWWVENGLGLWRFDSEPEAIAASVRLYRQWLGLSQNQRLLAQAQLALRGRDLACWCALPNPGQPDLCHAAVLLELVN